jgi:large conductance mechanosensitive channel
MPPISFLMPVRRNMEEKFWVLHHGPNYDRDMGYNTLQQARDDGAVVMAYGLFVNSTASFMFMGMVLYLTAVIYSKITRDNIIKHSVKCRYCRKRIHEKALRCIHCSSWVDGREDI